MRHDEHRGGVAGVTTAPSMRRNAAWALAGNAGYAACQFGILAAIAKTTTAADVGRFALALALTAPVIGFANLNLRAVQATDARGEYAFGDYLGLRLVTTALALVVIGAIAIALGYGGTTLALIVVVGAAKGCESLSDVAFGRLQRAENLRRVALSMLAKGAVSVLIVGALVRATSDLLVAALGLATCWAAVLAVHDVPTVARLGSASPRFHIRTLMRLAMLALPVGLVTAIASLTVNVPRYDVEASLGSVALGHFAAIAYVVPALSQPVFAIGLAVSPRLAQYFVADRAAYRMLARRTIASAAALGAIVVAAAAACGTALLRVAYTAEYAADGALLVWIAVATAVVFVSSALGYAVTAARRFREQTWIAAVTLVACAATSHVAVPRLGLVGAAWAVLASECLRAALLAALYRSAARAQPATRAVGARARSPRRGTQPCASSAASAATDAPVAAARPAGASA